MVARALIVLALASLFVPAATPCTASAQAGTAGVIVSYDELHTDEFCVPVADDARAVDALTSTGLDLTVGDAGGDRLTLRRIGGVGCDRDDCFCACRTTEDGCTFWGVYTLGARGRWRFADVGIGELKIQAGDVLGFRWAEQTPDGGAPPVAQVPQAVCARAAVRAPARERGSPAGLLAILGLAALLGAGGLFLRRTRP
jgi:hypothetical protein